MTTVETERLLLRPWCEADLDRLVGLYSNVEVMRFISGGVPLDRPRVEAMLDRVLRLWRERGFGPWAAIDKASGAWLAPSVYVTTRVPSQAFGTMRTERVAQLACARGRQPGELRDGW